ncbi:hypothetical protein A33Q_3173 [Indibacter alkaliphilus LW1]|jgi:hypothetical protein|uniref:Uncharacterized protein n=1 Tax=Indibacter alkaliphilus (strain CCUG 57479 / KCTC 22604 / LW1) TaxID=1189612 RepID=S2DUN4_INDAL|nr:hypothetical protein [Indibacter alkaliphilus]EOZ95811.1 hypothetical protein A33Q_3173 [Indibacter alkaliphilus LW1]
MKIFLSLLIFLIAVIPISAQHSEWGQPKVISFPRLDLLSLDNQGFIFIADLEGNLYQYNKEGLRVNNFSPHRQGSLTQLEAAWTVNIFTFSADLQEYRVLDRFINPVAENRIPMQFITLAKAATLGNNSIIWVYDEADLNIKQLDYRQNRVIQSQPLNLILDRSSLDVKDIREYQNMLFLNIEDEGVYILDNQANFLQQIPKNLNQKLSFWKNSLLSIEEGNLILTNFQNSKQDSFSIPEGITADQVSINAYAVIFYGKEKVWIYPKGESPLSEK